MKAFAAQLIVLACSLSALALHVRSVPRTVTDECSSAQEVSSSTFTVNGHEIVRQVFTCPGGNFTTGARSTAEAIRSSALKTRSLVEERSQAECTTPSPECQCGTSFECGCFEDSAAPSVSDCNTLIGSTAVISSIEGPTFIVQPGNVHAITLNTCTLGFVNLATTATEYCWDDLASSVSEASSCLQESSISNVVCTALDQRYITRLGLNI